MHLYTDCHCLPPHKFQNSEDSEDHYAMVPEEEQMYAEIGSGQDSGSSSITYAHIEPRELPPVPPTVESLKSVAHAHSRQGGSHFLLIKH